MGEEEKKPEEKQMKENKPEETKTAEEEKKGVKVETKQPENPAEEEKPEKSKDGIENKEQAPPPPAEIVLKVHMHCEGCARKVRRSLKGFEGVEDVITDCTTRKVVVKGEKADPLKVLERVQRKSHRQVELLSPIPKPPAEEEKRPEVKEEPKPEEKTEEVITVYLKVHMHCDACAQEIKRRIQRMKGVESAEPDLKNSLVSVKGVFDPAKLVEYVNKRTGKQAVIVRQEPEKKEKTEEAKGVAKEEQKAEEGDKDKKGGEGEENKENKEAEGEAKPAAEAAIEESGVVQVMKNEYYSYYPPPYANEYYYNPPTYAMEMYASPPQIFSDENPNACSVM